MRHEISLAPDGQLMLHLPRHSIRVPITVEGVALLRHVLQANEGGHTKLAEAGNPTQWDFDNWLKSPQGQGALQLAGERKRHHAIKQATGIEVRPKARVPLRLDDVSILDLL